MKYILGLTCMRSWRHSLALKAGILVFVVAFSLSISTEAQARDSWIVTSDSPITLTYSSSDSGCGIDSISNNSVTGHCTAGVLESQGLTLKATYTNPDHTEVTFFCEVYVSDPSIGDMSAAVGDFEISDHKQYLLEQAYCMLMKVTQTSAPGKDYAWNVSVIKSPATGNGTSEQ